MHARFYGPDAANPGDVVALPQDEAQHLTRVLRLKPGAAVRVFDGRGHEFDAVVEEAGKSRVLVRLGRPRQPVPEPRISITLAQAVLKGDKMDDVVRDAVMMGVAAIQPLVTTRSEVTLAGLARARRIQRWQRIAISSAKQCGRATVPRIHQPQAFESALHDVSHLTLPGPAFMFVEPAASSDAASLSEMGVVPPKEATVVIGPEGGWTSEEIGRAAPTCRLVTLGGRTLRADAMPIVALAALFALWREL